MNVTVKTEGDKALLKTLNALEAKFRGKVLRPAMRESTKPLIRTARSLVRQKGLVDDGDLVKSIGARIKTYRGGFVLAVVGPRWPQGAHGHLVEFGSTLRFTKGFLGFGRLSRGVMPANPFMQPAFLATHKQSLAIVARRSWQELDKLARREAKK